ncbi:hypothetical protein ABI_06270 [Asticcacaulis biprosthecium C19]|uniref:DMT family transporter n=1 Tax=Asticcacaulis biprosthecium C19 TaxID=715226 RepID=F4QKX1_9CAUL|nr:DMT family transporter [Asticcacaulis biprosthecium]EGF92194.1 hypothetical protein ABI_06270 [Asticcacaulis biprosthecium C19]
MNAGYAVWAFAAGALIPVMAAISGTLARSTGNPVLAVVVLFVVGLIASAAVLLATGTQGIATLPTLPPWLFTGGLIIAFYGLSVAVLTPRFGVGNTILFIVAAQIVTSTAIDHFGLFGAAVKPVNLVRLTGLAVLVVGVAITQLAAKSPTAAQ